MWVHCSITRILYLPIISGKFRQLTRKTTPQNTKQYPLKQSTFTKAISLGVLISSQKQLSPPPTFKASPICRFPKQQCKCSINVLGVLHRPILKACFAMSLIGRNVLNSEEVFLGWRLGIAGIPTKTAADHGTRLQHWFAVSDAFARTKHQRKQPEWRYPAQVIECVLT